MTKDKWIWMPHNGHLIIGHQCRFHLNTYVGGYIVSTVGEWWPDTAVRKIHAEVHDPQWLMQNYDLKGDSFDAAYFKRFGFEEIGFMRHYETMVFKAEKANKNLCCPWQMISGQDIDSDGYEDAVSAYKGHMKLCRKWSVK